MLLFVAYSAVSDDVDVLLGFVLRLYARFLDVDLKYYDLVW